MSPLNTVVNDNWKEFTQCVPNSERICKWMLCRRACRFYVVAIRGGVWIKLTVSKEWSHGRRGLPVAICSPHGDTPSLAAWLEDLGSNIMLSRGQWMSKCASGSVRTSAILLVVGIWRVCIRSLWTAFARWGCFISMCLGFLVLAVFNATLIAVGISKKNR